MNKKVIIAFLLLISSGISANFVDDITFPPLQFSIPEVVKEKSAINWYFFINDDVPLAKVEINLYGSHAILVNQPYELPEILAHTLLYGGSNKHPGTSLIAALEESGAHLEIVPEFKKIVIKLSFLTEDADKVLGLAQELLTDPAFDSSVMEDGKSKLIEEIGRRNERTEAIGFRKTKELVFHNMLEGKSGKIDSVKSISKEQIKNFYNYMIGDMPKAVLLFGKLDKENTKKKIEKMFATNPRKEMPSNLKTEFKEETIDYTALQSKFASFKTDRLFIEKEVSQSMVMMTGVLPPHNHPDFFPVAILNYIIGGGGFNSYFMTRIRSEQGLAYASVSYPNFTRDFGVLYCYTLTKTESTGQVYALMNEILSEKTFAAISAAEIENAKKAIINKFIFLFNEDGETIRNSLRFDEDNMPVDYLHHYREKIQAVTKKDILRAGKYFNHEVLKTVIVGKGSLKAKKSETGLPNFSDFKSILPEDEIVEQ